MSSPSVNRIITEAALSRHLEIEINKRASTNDISELISEVENLDGNSDGIPGVSPIALDTDGVPYITVDV